MGELANKMLLDWISKKIGQRMNINDGVEACRSRPGAVLIDVRDEDEFRSGHIPGSVNVPLSVISQISYPRETPLFLYCLRGHRSQKAADILSRMGFSNVYSIGGIKGYKGELE